MQPTYGLPFRLSFTLLLSATADPAGYIVFAIGFADADYGELVSIASRPSERHVFFVDDLDAFKKIEEQLVTFVCEAASASESCRAVGQCMIGHSVGFACSVGFGYTWGNIFFFKVQVNY